MHYTYIACVTIDSVMKIDKKNHRRVYVEDFKYKVKKIQMSRFISTELKSDKDSKLDSEEESKFGAELMTKLESGPDSKSDILLLMNFTHTFLLTLNKSFYCQ